MSVLVGARRLELGAAEHVLVSGSVCCLALMIDDDLHNTLAAEMLNRLLQTGDAEDFLRGVVQIMSADKIKTHSFISQKFKTHFIND